MERKAHYDSILDRNKRIMWQDDCYVDLQSTTISLQAGSAGKCDGTRSHNVLPYFCALKTASKQNILELFHMIVNTPVAIGNKDCLYVCVMSSSNY